LESSTARGNVIRKLLNEIISISRQYRHAALNDGGIRSENCVVRRLRRRANIIECTYTNLDSLLLLGYNLVQHVTVLNTVGNCNTMVGIVISYYNIIILWDHRRIRGPSSTKMSLCGAYLYCLILTLV